MNKKLICIDMGFSQHLVADYLTVPVKDAGLWGYDIIDNTLYMHDAY